ncbi:hypothetical protein GGI25_000324 [Coemansia spiralis]|uniref:Uncharacterized protein n=1 Tax=Coemansia spiralis TaxID=417178 RepID=A0A9W8GFB2_9FUNG|nr:hypothetical protein GGI25_000324 [Coemansia spiralis]
MLKKTVLEPRLNEGNRIKIICSSVEEALSDERPDVVSDESPEGASSESTDDVSDESPRSFDSASDESPGGVRDESSNSVSVEDVPKKQIKTTAGLYVHLESRIAKTTDRALEIHITYYDNPCWNLRTVIDMLKINKQNLRKVTYLNLILFAAHEDFCQSDSEIDAIIPQLKMLAQELWMLVPNVNYIKCRDPSRGPVATAFQKEILKLYVEQLKQIHCKFAYLSHVTGFSKGLRVLKLRNSLLDQQMLPRVYSSKLERLSMHGIDKDFNWSIFEDPYCLGHINFENLKDLSILPNSRFVWDSTKRDFTHKGPELNFSYKITAPRLISLHIKLHPLIFSILSSATLPAALKELTISEKNGISVRMNNVKTKLLVESVFAKYAGDNSKDIGYLDLFRDLSSTAELAKRIRVTIDRPLKSTDIRGIGKAYFTHLYIQSSIEFTELLDLISRLPKLAILTARQATFTVDSANPSSQPKYEISVQFIRKRTQKTLYADLIPEPSLENIEVYKLLARHVPKGIRLVTSVKPASKA